MEPVVFLLALTRKLQGLHIVFNVYFLCGYLVGDDEVEPLRLSSWASSFSVRLRPSSPIVFAKDLESSW